MNSIENANKGGGLGFIIVSIGLLAAPLGAKAANLLTNPGFETGSTSPWAARNCLIEVSADYVHSGSYSGRAYGRSSSAQGIQQDVLGKMVIGQNHQITGWVRTSSATSYDVTVSIEKTDSGGTTYTNVGSVSADNSGWFQLPNNNYTLTVNGTLSALVLYFDGPPSGVDIYVDDAVVDGPVVGQVDPMIRHQTIEGFGASGAWYDGTFVNHPREADLYNVCFRNLGLDIYRVRNTYGISSSYIDNTAQIVAGAEAALGHPLKIMISSWSPPAYLKSNDNTRQGTLKKDAYGQYMYDEFAQWWYDSLVDFNNHGISAEYVNMQNEPDFQTPDWDSCVFWAYETEDWAGYNLAFEAFYDRLSSMPNPPKLLAAESAGLAWSWWYLDNLIDTNHVYGYSHHLYDGEANEPDGYIPDMEYYAANYGDKPWMQTEFSGNEGAFADAMNLALLMHNSLTVEKVSVYLYWDLFWPNPGGMVGLTTTSYSIHPVYYAFKHFSAYTDPGWQRLEASTNWPDLRISAYVSPDNNQLSIVIINPSATGGQISLDLSNFAIDSGKVYRTSPTEPHLLKGNFDPCQPLSVPASSIITVALVGQVVAADCQQVWQLGYILDADLDGNCYVDLNDLMLMTDYWLAEGPIEIPPSGHSPDIYVDGEVNFCDSAVLSSDWLNCNNPEDSNCPP